MHHSKTRRRGAGVVATVALALGLVVAVQAPAHAAPATIQPVPVTAAHSISTAYSLTVNGTPVPVNGYASELERYDYAEFAMGSGTAQITVTKLDGTAVSKTYITPIKDNHVATHSGSNSTFTISAPKYLIVKLDTGRRLIISAEPAETNVPATSGAGIFRVGSSAFPADASGNNLSTPGVQAAIDAASAYGTAGGTRGVVYIPAGVYALANIELRSNIDVYFAPGSVWRMRADKSLYSVDAHKTSQNRDLTWWIQTEFGSENITMRGRGTLDGNGKAAYTSGFGMNILAPIATTNFRLDGLTIRESASWAVIPTRSDNLRFTHMKIFNRFDMGENDGIDVIESQNVVVQYGVAIGHDDPYSTKSWPKSVGITTNWPGDPEVVQNVAFDRLISWTGCFGFKVGQGVVSNHTDVRFTNSVIHDSSVGIGINHQAGAGTAGDIEFRNIDIERVTKSNGAWRMWALFQVKDAYGDGAGPIDGVTVSHINVRDDGTATPILSGFSPTSNIRNMVFDSIRMPGSTGYATSLAELGFTSPVHTANIVVQ